MSNPENYVQLTDTVRIAVYRDEYIDTESPLQLQEGYVGCFPLRVARNLNGYFAGDDETQAGIRNVVDNTEATDYGNLQNEIVEYLESQGNVVATFALTGYSQGEWMDVVLWADPKVGDTVVPYEATRNLLAGVAKDLLCHFRGDVFTLTLESLVVYTSPTGKTIERWETDTDVDPVYGNFFSERPSVEELLELLDVYPPDYGVAADTVLELAS